MSGTGAPANPLEMADEDFLKLNDPPAAEAADEGDQGNQDESEGNDGDDGEGTAPAAVVDEGDIETQEEDGTVLKDDEEQVEVPSVVETPETPSGDEKVEDKSDEGAGTKKEVEEGDSPTTPDYKSMYEKVMAPLKANGKTIDLKSPEELVQLAQMGANYTRKMQAIAPHRKVLLMLENNDLLDEGKLSYLIDLDKKNPEAIKKLIKDAGIDPLEIDLDDPQAKPYLEGNHRVSDEETVFRAVLDELGSNPEGKATLQVINSQWDQASKEVLWTQPEVMSLIHQQRENGIYDRISTEVERQRTLGVIPPNVPFLQAYKVIGDQLASAGNLDDLVNPAPQSNQPERTPVAKTVAKPKPVAANGDKVNAASSTRSNPREAKTTVNPLALADEDFMKQVEQFQGRL